MDVENNHEAIPPHNVVDIARVKTHNGRIYLIVFMHQIKI